MKGERITVEKQKFLLLCIDILKAPEGLVNGLTKDFAEEEILRLSNGN